ncbi:hypothetical protein NA57DRAFT_71491 [Rhizodiscina lignyota]|uniref:Clr5 domain-containing protein n=1 Tax=Rhizodiscina lignyota TaxID=1504668 RepID=A0A9P4IJ32_9PEZI|nr:hypothetical protein NA57DRAFT_71491 [Rhizodiscina lignyota]
MQNVVQIEDHSPRPAKRAKTTKQASWEDYKDDIYELYAVQNRSIEDLMSTMAEKGLHASRRTYMKRITEWGFNKKIRRAEKEQMLRIERHRSAIGKRTVFRIRGQEVTAAKLRRAAPTVDDPAPSPTENADTPSCISYETPESGDPSDPDKDVDASEPDDTPVYTPAWATDPAEHFWRTRNAARNNELSLRRHSKPPSTGVPLQYERDMVTWYNFRDDDEHRVTESDMESLEIDETETGPVYDTSMPKPFNLRKFLTSSMPGLNYDFHQIASGEQLDAAASPAYLTGSSADSVSRIVSDEDIGDADLGSNDTVSSISDIRSQFDGNLGLHLTLFRAEPAQGEDRDRTRYRHFSNILGILKSRYDREAATLALMGMVFGDGDVETEDQAKDKLEVLLEQRNHLYGFEHKYTLDACLAGVIFLLDATRLDAEQNTWSQQTVFARLERARSLIHRVFAAHLREETVRELLGDESGHDVLPPEDVADEEASDQAERLMADVVEQAVRSQTVLHALELLPRYHRQWAGYHCYKREELMRERPSLFTM